MLWATLFAVLVDQGIKWLIVTVVMQPPAVIPLLPFFNLRLGFNTGVSFGMFSEFFADAPVLLAGLMLLMVGALTFWALHVRSVIEAIGLGLIVGGALGNITDRLRIGAVVDFLDLHVAGWHWPTFNTADIAISAGAASLLLTSMVNRDAVKENAEASLP